jgi:hypothetical protein
MQLKIDYKGQIVGQTLTNMIYKWMRLVRQTVKGAEGRRFIMRSGGDTGTVRWFDFDATDLDWEPEVIIETGSFRKAVMAEQLQKWTAALNTLIQLLPVIGPGARVDRAAYEMLRALELPAGQLIASQADEQMLAMADLVFILAGSPVQPDPQGNPAARIQVIDFFLNSPAAQVIAERNPAALQEIRALRQAYQEILLQSTQAATSMRPAPGSNPLDNQVMSPANMARSDSAREREAVQPQEGNAGQLG